MIAIIQVEEKNIQPIQIQCTVENTLAQIFDKFLNKVLSGSNEKDKIDINDYIFFINRKEIKKEQKIKELIENKAGENKIILISIKKRSKVMKCPVCECNNCIIQINNYGLYFSDCKYKEHKCVKIFADYETSQKIDFRKIKCVQCGKTQEEDLKDFYKCLNCTKKYTYYLCENHSNEHNQKREEKDKHKLIKYDEKYYYCSKHHMEFISYCKTCNINLCKVSETEHKNKNHITEKFNEMESPKIESITKEIEIIKEKTDEIKDQIFQLKKNLDEAVGILDKYYLISKDIIEKYKSFNTKLINYQVIKTVNYLSDSNKLITQQLKNFLTKTDWSTKYKILCDIYNADRKIYAGYSKQGTNESINKEKNETSPNESRKINNSPKNGNSIDNE